MEMLKLVFPAVLCLFQSLAQGKLRILILKLLYVWRSLILDDVINTVVSGYKRWERSAGALASVVNLA